MIVKFIKSYFFAIFLASLCSSAHSQQISTSCEGAGYCGLLSKNSCNDASGCYFNNSTNNCSGVFSCSANEICFIEAGCYETTVIRPAPLSNMLIKTYDADEGELRTIKVKLYSSVSSVPSAPLYSFNIADSNSEDFSWKKDAMSKVRVEYSSNKSNWKYMHTFSEAVYDAKLCMSNDGSSFLPDSCKNIPYRVGYPVVYFRFRPEIDNGFAAQAKWQYIRPIRVYKQS